MSRDRVEARFGAMGREARVVVLSAPPRLDERARHLIEVLERKWSRFRSGSEISRLNATNGRAVVVSPETFGLVERAVAAWRVTGGRYDPSVAANVSPGTPPGFAPSPGCSRVELDARLRSVRVPAGVHLDLGAIGSGFATDLAVADLLHGGATGSLVSIGKDVRVAGEPPRVEGWFVDIDDPHQPGSLGRLRLREGAIATASGPSGVAANGVASVTVVAGEGWWAQVVAKAAVTSGPDGALPVLAEHHVTGVAVLDDGTVLEAPGLAAFF
jgi:thiamine biosynthesis lipoprotein